MARNIRELGYIHALSSSHRAAIQATERCGCFYCLALFTPAEIKDWVDDVSTGVGQTALCPRCGIDAVLPAGPSLKVDVALLLEMESHYFGMLGDEERAAALRASR